MNNHIETEVRFLNIDVDKLKIKLSQLGAEDHGEDLLREIIFYDQHGEWQKAGNKMVRLRSTKDRCLLSYKHNFADHSTGTTEIELQVDNPEKARSLLKELGLQEYRQQEKVRHSFSLNGIAIDIDQWPKIPAYAELEGENEEEIRVLATELGFEWSEADTHNAAWVIENIYNIPVRQLKYFTFTKVE